MRLISPPYPPSHFQLAGSLRVALQGGGCAAGSVDRRSLDHPCDCADRLDRAALIIAPAEITAGDSLSYTQFLQSRQYCVINVAMLAALITFLVTTLAFFAWVRYRLLRTRGELPQFRDLDELNEVVNGILKRERGRAGRERAQYSRDNSAAGAGTPDISPSDSDRPFGGVVRKEVAGEPAAAAPRRRA